MSTTAPPSLSSDVHECLKLFSKHSVRFLIVGSWAMAFHGRPRYTKDIDILVHREEKNAERIMLALSDFGFGSVGLSKNDFLKDEFVVELGYEPNRIDILTRISGVEFEEAETDLLCSVA